MSQQIIMVTLDELVPTDHMYRRFNELWDFESVKGYLRAVGKDSNYKGYGLLRLFKCLLLQFMEDLSDRELERYLQENNAGKWFCGFGLTDITPNFTVFTKARSRIGTKKLSKIFSILRDQLIFQMQKA